MEISWDEALDALADRIVALRKKGIPEALAAVDGNPLRSAMSLLIERLLEAIGSPHYMRIPSAQDTFAMVNILMQGNSGPLAYDLENSDYVLSFGAGILEGWGAPGRILDVWRIWEEGSLKGKARVVQIESRASNTASKADQWVAIRPGTEAALALGLAHVIIRERLYDAEFIDRYTFGFEDIFSSEGNRQMGFGSLVLTRYEPSRVAGITGLSADEIVSLAKAFAGAKAPIALCGKGALSGSLYEFMAIHSLNALLGNINKPGGVLVHDPMPLTPLPGVEGDAVSREGLRKPRLDKAKSNRYPFTPSLLNILSEAILEASDSPINMFLFFSSNPVFTLPYGAEFLRALQKVPFIVSFSPYRDETSRMADLILPDHNYLEKMDDIVWPSGLQYPVYGLTRAVVEPLYDTRHAGDVIIKLAKRIGETVGKNFPWKSYEDLLEFRAKGLYESQPGLVSYDGSTPIWRRMKEGGDVVPDYDSFEEMWEKIKSEGIWYRPVHVYKSWDSIFKTRSRRFEFFSTRIALTVLENPDTGSVEALLKETGIWAQGAEVFLPHYEESQTDNLKEDYPLQMVPYEMINLPSDWLPGPPFLKKTLFDHQLRGDESFAEINPETGAEHDLKEGDRILLESPKGTARVRVHLFDGAMPGIVYMPLGLGHTAYDEFLQRKGVNLCHIISAGKDPLSGYPVWWDTRVKIRKA